MISDLQIPCKEKKIHQICTNFYPVRPLPRVRTEGIHDAASIVL